MTRFVTIFPGFRNIHFYKDPGQIPYRVSKSNIQTEIVCYRNERLQKETTQFVNVRSISNSTISRRFNIGLIWYLVRNARKIDVLNVFHIQWLSLWLAFLYKFLNRKGFVYLKMDSCMFTGKYFWEDILAIRQKILTPDTDTVVSIKERIKNRMIPGLIKRIDLFSVEDEASCQYYKEKYKIFKGKICTSYNGHTIDLVGEIELIEFSNKENIVFSAGRFGTKPKATEILLDAFVEVARRSSWQLHLAGSVEDSFKPYIEDFFIKHPDMDGRIIFKGALNRSELFDLYNRSKIFCLPSRWEGFANVFSEAMYFSNAIVTTPSTSLRDIVLNKEIGELVDVDNSEQLSSALLKIINNPLLNELYGDNARLFCSTNLSWDSITNLLLSEIETRMV